MNRNNAQVNAVILQDAIKGLEPSSFELCQSLMDRGLGVLESNGWNEKWSWNKIALSRMNHEQLCSLYTELKTK